MVAAIDDDDDDGDDNDVIHCRDAKAIDDDTADITAISATSSLEVITEILQLFNLYYP